MITWYSFCSRAACRSLRQRSQLYSSPSLLRAAANYSLSEASSAMACFNSAPAASCSLRHPFSIAARLDQNSSNSLTTAAWFLLLATRNATSLRAPAFFPSISACWARTRGAANLSCPSCSSRRVLLWARCSSNWTNSCSFPLRTSSTYRRYSSLFQSQIVWEDAEAGCPCPVCCERNSPSLKETCACGGRGEGRAECSLIVAMAQRRAKIALSRRSMAHSRMCI